MIRKPGHIDFVCATCGTPFFQYNNKDGTPRKYCSYDCYWGAEKEMTSQEVTQEFLKKVLDYDPQTGIFTWKITKRGRGGRVEAGTVAGHHSDRGYITLRLNKKLYLAHRLAWLFVYGNWPSKILDHINLDRANNSIANLREVTPTQNNMNMPVRCDSQTGVKGVQWDRGRWKAQIQCDRKSKYLGRFTTFEAAVAARRAAEEQLFGEYARDE